MGYIQNVHYKEIRKKAWRRLEKKSAEHLRRMSTGATHAKRFSIRTIFVNMRTSETEKYFAVGIVTGRCIGMNKVILIGRLTRDPEVRYSQGDSSTAIAKFSIAVDRRFKRDGEPDADFFNCTAFGKQAEFAERYLKKGTKMAVVGRIQNDNYTNRDGQKVYSVQIMVEEMEFAESKGTNAAAGQSEAPAADKDGFMNIPDGLQEELPFM